MRYLKSLYTMIHESISLYIPEDQSNLLLVQEDLRWLSDMMNAIFYYTVGIILLNLLIAIINSTYSFYTSYNDKIKGYNNEAILLIEKANVMNYFEDQLSSEEIHEYRDKYSMIKLMKPIQLAKSGEVNAESRKDNGDAGRDLKLVEMNPLHSIEKWKYFFQLQDEIPGWSESVGAASLFSSLSICLLLLVYDFCLFCYRILYFLYIYRCSSMYIQAKGFL